MESGGGLTFNDTLSQVQRMCSFIEAEGEEKAQMILDRCDEEYHLVIGNTAQAGRILLAKQYDRKMKDAIKERITNKSNVLQEHRMALQQKRNEIVNQISNEIVERMKKDIKDSMFNEKLMHNCLLQSLVILLEKDIVVQVIQKDKSVVENVLSKVREDFEKITGNKCNIKIAKKYLPEASIGGCVAFNRRFSLKVTNTLNERFRIIMDRIVVTTLKETLFGPNPSRKHHN